MVALRERTSKITYLKMLLTRNSSGDEIANVNFLRRHPVHEIDEIMQNKGHYPVQGLQSHRFWYNQKQIYDFLLVINTNYLLSYLALFPRYCLR